MARSTARPSATDASTASIKNKTAATAAILRRFHRANTEEDRRGITPLFWSHISPYGEVKVDMTRRISLHGDIARLPDE
jgi:hypothetical protein